MKIRAVIEFDLRDMTEAEYEDAGGNEDITHDGWVEDMVADGFVDLYELISGALDSEANPEMFSGSDVYCVTEHITVVSIEALEQSDERMD